ncbi:putative reverse transcriptase domain-containing protein [Tanacetum coccineum]
MRQRRWIKVFSDYNCVIRYHQGKANVVADALSRKERVKPRRVREMSMTIQSSVKDKILVAQGEVSKVENAPAKILRGLDQQIEKKEDGGLYFMDRIWVPLVSNIRTIIMDEVHSIIYSIHSGVDKMYYDLLTKSAHFLAIREDYKMEKLARIYIDEIVARHEVPMLIISDRDGKFTLRQSERTIQTLEDLLRACVIDLVALYGRKCRSHVLWAKVRENRLIGPEMVQETTDKVVLIKERLKAARDRQKSYADNRRKPLEFEVGDQVLLKVSPWKGVVHFGKKGKLAPRYVGPFEILERICPVAYRLILPQELNSVHDTFHVLNLKNCLADANLHVPLEEIKVDKTLHFVEEPVEIMDREVKKLKHSRILIVKNEVNILKSIDEGPFQMGTCRETLSEGNKGALHLGPKRPRVYSDMSPEDKDRYNADIRVTNILLQGLQSLH